MLSIVELSRVEEPILELCCRCVCAPLRSLRSSNLCWTTRSENWRRRLGMPISVLCTKKAWVRFTFPFFGVKNNVGFTWIYWFTNGNFNGKMMISSWICYDLLIYWFTNKQLDFGQPCFWNPTCWCSVLCIATASAVSAALKLVFTVPVVTSSCMLHLYSFNVGKTINHPFWNGLYHLFKVMWGMVHCCFTHYNIL